VGDSDFLSLGFAAVGDASQIRLNDVRREFLQLQDAMAPAEGRDHRPIRSQSVFFEWDR
jgi:hypothetical protein